MDHGGRRQPVASGAGAGVGRSTLVALSREDLEDRHLRLKESYQDLKKLNVTQEDKMKRMATKLIRLTNDFKKDKAGVGAGVDSREQLAELKSQVHDLERKNEMLANKLQVARQQLDVRQQYQGPFRHVAARIDSGISRPPAHGRGRHPKPAVPPQPSSPVLPRYGHSLLEEERARSAELEQIVAALENELEEQKQLLLMLQQEAAEKLRFEQARHVEEMQKEKQVLIATQRKNIAEDVSLIRLQRQLKEKCAHLESLQTKFLTAEQQIEKLKVNHANVLLELSDFQDRLKEEEHRCHKLQSSLAAQKVTKHTVVELQEIVEDLRAEKKLLQDSNNKLVSSAFDARQERQHKAQVQLMQDQVNLLESGKKQLLMDKSEILEQLANEKERLAVVQQEVHEVNSKFFRIKEENEKLQEKVDFFSTESSVNFSELEEALALVKSQKQHGTSTLALLQPLPGELDVISQAKRKSEAELSRLQTVFTQTRQELEKTRHLLNLQCKINSDLQAEKDLVENKLTGVLAESEENSKEQEDLLTKQAAKNNRLQQQLHDLAYGTKQLKPLPDTSGDLSTEAGGGVLQAGQNCLEIHLREAELSSDAEETGLLPPLCFLSLRFLDFETVITNCLPSSCPIFNYTAEYVLEVNDFLIHALQSCSWTLQLHGACGVSWSDLAIGQIHLGDLLSTAQDRLHGTVTLIGTGENAGVPFGTVRFWARLRHSVERALQLYRKRKKALCYVSSNVSKDDAAHLHTSASAVRSPPAGGPASDPVGSSNTLKVTVVSCRGLPSAASGLQPSAYVVYKFLNSADHATGTVAHSNSPQFNDTCHFTPPVSQEFDEYLRSQVLTFFIFDDNDSNYLTYIGTADLVLLPLLQQSSLKQTRPLLSPQGKPAGKLHVELAWEHGYKSAITPSNVQPSSAPLTELSSPEVSDIELDLAATGQSGDTLSETNSNQDDGEMDTGELFSGDEVSALSDG